LRMANACVSADELWMRKVINSANAVVGRFDRGIYIAMTGTAE
jgi:hypothetical protein